MDGKTLELKKKVEDLSLELAQHGNSVNDSKCAALCETSSEVLKGIAKAFEHFINKSENAWKD